jgi:uncharacterized protein (DUF952 family)
MSILYHLAAASEWEEALTQGSYSPAALQREGYLLCVEAGEYVDLANRIYVGRNDLVILFIERDRVQANLQCAEIDGLPILKLLAPLPLHAVFEVTPPEVDLNGRFTPHHEMRAFAVHGGRSLNDVHARILQVMTSFSCPWWVAGGWAIDSFLGQRSRPHADLEISLLSADQPALREHLQGWDLRVAANGMLTPWDGKPLTPPYHQLWVRQGKGPALTPDDFSADPTMLDILIEAHVDDVWHYRRDGAIARPLQEFGGIRNGVPFVRPEIALLYKAKAMRFKDQRDFEAALPHLDNEAKQWLVSAIRREKPQHPWCNLIDATISSSLG